MRSTTRWTALALVWAVVAVGCADDGGSPPTDTRMSDGADAPDGDSAVVDSAETSHDADTFDAADTSPPEDTATADTTADSGPEDSRAADTTPDSSADTDDAAEIIFPVPGFGVISGTCDVLDDELTSEAPAFVRNAIDFGSDPYDDSDLSALTAGGQEIIADGNAGGSSLMSEVFSYEVLARCEAAVLLKTETEIAYVGDGKITDLLVEIDGLKIGVSVTRAVGWPRDAAYTVDNARDLLEDKLADVLVSSGHVAAIDAWEKQILHVIAYADGHATSVESAWAGVSSDLRADTILFVTVSDGDDAFIYD